MFIKDSFNLAGLKKKITNYSIALKMILGESPESEDLEKESFSEILHDYFPD
jgi:hypothetical protein